MLLYHQRHAVDSKDARLLVPVVVQHIVHELQRATHQQLWTEEDQLRNELNVETQDLYLALELLLDAHVLCCFHLKDLDDLYYGIQEASNVKLFHYHEIPLRVLQNDDDRLQRCVDARDGADGGDGGLVGLLNELVGTELRDGGVLV